ncbi:MAG: hypothetical protein MJY80_03665 [Bacteroidales bacterium]|nr:hypothetical protein [Bacteroidales bacterium]
MQSDSAAFAADSAFRADSIARTDSLALLQKSSLELPAFTSATDSIIEDFTNGNKRIYYYGGVTVKYQNMTLTSDYMEYDMSTGTVFARGTLDTLTGEWKGRPVMEQGGSKYEMHEVRYNFNSRKARISNMESSIGEGVLRGNNIKMMPDQSINITDGKYTVCDEEEPHYYIRMTSAKVLTKPAQHTVFGPAFPVVEGVTLPVVVPFGFIPKIPERATGILLPTFGEETARGFYMKDAGLYFVIGDYFDVSLTGTIFTMGSWSADLNSRYKVNYKMSGNVSVNYSVDQTGEPDTPEFFKTSNFGFKWSHSMDSKARPGTSFSASVNFSSPSNSRYNSHSVSEALQNQTSSSISYSKNWNGKMNLSINALHNQNSRDSSYTITLPNLTFSVSTFYPFKRKNRVGSEKFYEKFSLGYSTSLQNKIAFKSSEFMQEGFFDKLQNGMTHNFNIGLPNFTLFKYINLNPSVNYGMNWFFRATDYEYNPETDKVEAHKGGQFSAFGITQTYSGSISMDTRLYGMFNFGKHHAVQAIRHVISPSMSVSYSPDLATAANGWRKLEYVDAAGKEQTYEYNRYAGQMNSVPGKGQSGNLNFSVGNNFEAKVRDAADTTGTGTKKIKLIDQLNLSGNYNFLADSMKLSNLGITMSTTIFEKLNIHGNLNFDPYSINGQGQRYNKLCAPRLVNASASLSYSLSGKGAINGNAGGSSETGYEKVYYHPITGEYIPGGWTYYTNPNSPWSLNFNYNFNYARSYSYSNEELHVDNKFTNTLGITGNIKLTPKMNINFNTGFDFMAMKLTTTQISATYDLHCFNISVSWVPTGKWQSYEFRIAANASALADILQFRKNSSYWDN